MNGEGRTTLPGLYSCTLDESTGRCDESRKVVDTLYQHDGDRHRGVDLSNVILNDSKTKVYAGYFEGPMWQLFWAPLEEEPDSMLQVYFSLPRVVYTNKSKGHDCSQYDSRFAFYEVIPVDYVVDENDNVFISWEGYFQDCQDPEDAPKGLVWSIGVSQVNLNCTMSKGVVSFDDCTTVTSIFYRGYVGKGRRLGHGFAMSLSGANGRLFYLTVQNSEYSYSIRDNEIWVMPDGIHKDPFIMSTPNVPEVMGYLSVQKIIPDVSTLRLSLDENRLPRALCRTVYNKGIYCHTVEMEEFGPLIEIRGEPILSIGEDQVAESCTIPESPFYDVQAYMSPMSTGLEVLWGEDGLPDLFVFGCYGKLAGRGNMTTVFRDERMVQTMEGAYPGSILLGTDLPKTEPYYDPMSNMVPGKSPDNDLSLALPLVLSSGFIAVIVVVWIAWKRRHKTTSAATSSKSTPPMIEIEIVSSDDDGSHNSPVDCRSTDDDGDYHSLPLENTEAPSPATDACRGSQSLPENQEEISV